MGGTCRGKSLCPSSVRVERVPPMTTIRTLATHQVVSYVYPRPPTERQELGMAVGKAIDSTLSKYGHDFRRGFRPTVGAMSKLAEATLTEELRDIDLPVADSERTRVSQQITAVLQAFRKTEVFGLPRPRSRLVLIDERVGVYAQPDYWDGRTRFYEMKSFRAIPPPPEVALQVRLFQLAFPGFEARLICVDRHSAPPSVTTVSMPALSQPVATETLRQALRASESVGASAVLDFVDVPVVRYSTTGQ